MTMTHPYPWVVLGCGCVHLRAPLIDVDRYRRLTISERLAVDEDLDRMMPPGVWEPWRVRAIGIDPRSGVTLIEVLGVDVSLCPGPPVRDHVSCAVACVIPRRIVDRG